ncbi:MAG: type II toxin-antitoxin system VapC family toxin [Acetobacteraceae bacterium]
MGVIAGGLGPGAATGLLLDTHALIWWWTDDPRLPAPARAVIADPARVVHVSAASAWELATKHRLGKWPEAASVLDQFDDLLRRSRFAPLPITPAEARTAGALDWAHRDPFDRMLLAQATALGLALVSGDAAFAGRGVARIW